MQIMKGGVTAVPGFEASSVAAGIKYKNRTDMALVYSKVPATVAGVFTTNVVKAAPVKWDQKIVKECETAQAMVFNSGIANACTSKVGDEANEAMAKAIADSLSIPVKAVLTASTGVIGMSLPVDKIVAGGKMLTDSLEGTLEAGHKAAKAIMTTDTISKEVAVEITLGGKTVHMAGMSKGSGMIHPNMATMLALVTTDAVISKTMLQKVVSTDVKDTFNMISVDRDTSTNDTLIVLANGLAGNQEIVCEDEEYQTFYEAFHYICETLAKMMAGDGEGASKLFETKVINANSKEEAVKLSKSVITSNLVKSMLFGRDANCGRIMCALGYAGVEFDPEQVDLYIESVSGKLQLIKDGVPTGFDEEFATKILSDKEVTAICDMHQGDGAATAWGCDLTYDYVKINGDYRS